MYYSYLEMKDLVAIETINTKILIQSETTRPRLAEHDLKLTYKYLIRTYRVQPYICFSAKFSAKVGELNKVRTCRGKQIYCTASVAKFSAELLEACTQTQVCNYSGICFSTDKIR
jgi:hypothetical protein